jgi:hypothetical protein
MKSRAEREQNQATKNEQQCPKQPAVEAEEAATVLAPSELVSKFHDSGVGTSVQTGSLYAETVMTYRRQGTHSVRIPPLSEEAKHGKPFDCLACGKEVTIRSNSAWKYDFLRDSPLS